MQITLLVCLFWQRLYPYGARSVAERSRRRSGRMQLLRMRVVLLSVDQPEPKEHLLAPTTYSKFEVPFVCLLLCVSVWVNTVSQHNGQTRPHKIPYM